MLTIKNKNDLDVTLLKGTTEYLGKKIKIFNPVGDNKDFEAVITEVSLSPLDEYFYTQWRKYVKSGRSGAESLSIIRDLAFDEQILKQRNEALQNKVEMTEHIEKVNTDDLIEKLNLNLVFFVKSSDDEKSKRTFVGLNDFELI